MIIVILLFIVVILVVHQALFGNRCVVLGAVIYVIGVKIVMVAVVVAALGRPVVKVSGCIREQTNPPTN